MTAWDAIKLLLRLWPLWLVIACLAMGWHARGVNDAADRGERIEDEAHQAAETDQTEAADQQANEEISREITDSIRADGARISPYLECLLRAVDARRPATDCVPDRVRSPQLSLGSIADGSRRGEAGGVPRPGGGQLQDSP